MKNILSSMIVWQDTMDREFWDAHSTGFDHRRPGPGPIQSSLGMKRRQVLEGLFLMAPINDFGCAAVVVSAIVVV